MRRKKKRVADWPAYLLKDIPAFEREQLSASAADQDVSVSDVVRGLLCARYKLNCPAASYGYNAAHDEGGTTILLRLQPKLAAALDREAARTRNPRRRIILNTIAAHYTKGEPSND